MDELYPFLGINHKNILKKSCLQECALTAGTYSVTTLVVIYIKRQTKMRAINEFLCNAG